MRLLSTFLAALVALPACAQQGFDDIEITATEVSGQIHMLEGAGGNMGLFVGEEFAFLIDDQFAPLSAKIKAKIATITDLPVQYVLNTHYHGDHTGGNEAFGDAGAHIVAHDNVRSRLKDGDNVSPVALPVITFSDTSTFFESGEEIHIFHPDNAHTDGDAIVYFRTSNVLHTGDVMFAGRFPYIDIDGGGSLPGYIDALERIAATANDDTKIIPGHGPLSSKADALASIAMLKDVSNRIQALIDEGKSLEETVAAKPLDDLQEEWGWRFIDAERMTRSAFLSLSQ